MTLFANWEAADDTLVDLGLYDPVGCDVAASLATTSEGNAVQVQDPVAGLWTVTLAYGDNTTPPIPLDWVIGAMLVMPLPIDGFSAPDWAHPVDVASEGQGTVTAQITVPADAAPGDTDHRHRRLLHGRRPGDDRGRRPPRVGARHHHRDRAALSSSITLVV